MKCYFRLVCLLMLISQKLMAVNYDFVLTGRITEDSGKPVEGPVALSVKFYHVATGGDPVLTVTTGLESVTLQEGVFQIRVILAANDYQTVFPSVTQATYFEITDLTNAPNSPYERSQVTMLPYASKIPINDDIFSFNSDGLLTFSAAPEAGKYLMGNADGTISWDTPGGASSAETFTNKTIDADDNTIADISNANIKAAAGIVDSKLATISTAGKVSGGAITSGTIGGTTAVNTSGNIATSGSVGANAFNMDVSNFTWLDGSRYAVNANGSAGFLFASSTLFALYRDLFATKADPAVIFNTATATDTDFWMGVQEDAGGDDDDVFQIGDGTTPGTNAFLTINTSGNVGIGITGPASSLDINGADDNTNPTDVLTFGLGGAAGAANAKSRLGTRADYNANRVSYWSANYKQASGTNARDATTQGSAMIMLRPNDDDDEGQSGITFWTGLVADAAPTVRMNLTQEGKLGIGTTSPATKLDVAGTGGQVGLSVGPTDNNYGVINLRGGTPGSLFQFTKRKTADNDRFGLYYSADGSAFSSELLTVLTGGNVGIGATNPGSKLEVNASSDVQAVFKANSGNAGGIAIDTATANTASALYFRTQGTNKWGLLGNYTSSAFVVYDYIGGGSRLTVLPTSGNVGIGVDTPTYKLQVNGEPAANGYTAFTNYSDRRLKRDIKPLGEGFLEKILKLNPASFYYNDLSGYDEATKRRKIYGFVAQELKTVFPEMVNKTKIHGEEYLDTNLSSLQIYLVKAVQELSRLTKNLFAQHTDEISQLKDELKVKDAHIKALEERDAAVREYLCAKDPEAPFCQELAH